MSKWTQLRCNAMAFAVHEFAHSARREPDPVDSDPPLGDHEGLAPGRYAPARVCIAPSTIAGRASALARGEAKALTCVRMAKSSSDFTGVGETLSIPFHRLRRYADDLERVWAPCSRARIAAVVANPPISGICTSMTTVSNRRRASQRA